MKSFIQWAKSNLVVAVLLLLSIVAIPVMMFFSGRWAGTVRKGIETDAQQNLRELNSLTTTYTIPPILPGEQELAISVPPNEATTEYVRGLRAQLTAATEEIRDKAVEWNSRGKSALFSTGPAEERLFPAPANESARLQLTRRMIQVWPAEHETLLQHYHVGQPPDAAALASELNRLRERERTAIVEGRVDQNLTAEESEQIARTLQNARIARYHDAAKHFTVYGDMSIFRAVKPLGENEVPTVERLWDWQHILWVHNDILQAIQAANSTGAGDSAVWDPVYSAPVKRILAIDVAPRDYASGTVASTDGTRLPGGNAFGGGSAMPGGEAPGATPLGQDFSTAHTGRAGWPGSTNPVYDVRYATVEVIVASDRIPDLLDAIARTNFMTVIDFDLKPADAYDALRQGYDFGPDHVVNATIRIETVWIHEWIRKFMPATVRTALAVPPDPASAPPDPAVTE